MYKDPESKTVQLTDITGVFELVEQLLTDAVTDILKTSKWLLARPSTFAPSLEVSESYECNSEIVLIL